MTKQIGMIHNFGMFMLMFNNNTWNFMIKYQNDVVNFALTCSVVHA